MEITEKNGQLLIKTEQALVIVEDDFVQVMTDVDTDGASGHCIEIYPSSNQLFIDPESERKARVDLPMVDHPEYFVVRFEEPHDKTIAVHESQMAGMGERPPDPSAN